MVVLEQRFFDQILRHLIEEYPNEGCGAVMGREGRVTEICRMKNADVSSRSYSFDPEEQLRLLRRAEREKLELMGIYHSHPSSEALPSLKDVSLAYDQHVYYLIVSLVDLKKPIARVFRIADGKIEEDKLIQPE